MPRYDPDVIAALAEGRLDPEEAATVEREIAADPVAATQLAELRVALEAAAEAARPELTVSERSDLRAAVADALGITTPEVAAQPLPRRVPWGSLGIAAAALAGLIAVVPVVGLLSTGGADDAATLDLAAEAAPTTIAEPSAARSALTDETESVVAAAEADDALTTGDASGSDAPAFDSSTALPATTSPPPAGMTTQATTNSEGSTTSTTADPAVEQLTAELGVIRSDPKAVNDLAVEAAPDHECWVDDGEIRANPPPQRFVFEYDNGELTVIVYFEREEGVAGPFQVWGVPDCADLVVIP
jgi:hypothetical protein